MHGHECSSKTPRQIEDDSVHTEAPSLKGWERLGSLAIQQLWCSASAEDWTFHWLCTSGPLGANQGPARGWNVLKIRKMETTVTTCRKGMIFCVCVCESLKSFRRLEEQLGFFFKAGLYSGLLRGSVWHSPVLHGRKAVNLRSGLLFKCPGGSWLLRTAQKLLQRQTFWRNTEYLRHPFPQS